MQKFPCLFSSQNTFCLLEHIKDNFDSDDSGFCIFTFTLIKLCIVYFCFSSKNKQTGNKKFISFLKQQSREDICWSSWYGGQNADLLFRWYQFKSCWSLRLVFCKINARPKQTQCHLLSAAEGQRPRNYLSCCCSCSCYQLPPSCYPLDMFVRHVNKTWKPCS